MEIWKNTLSRNLLVKSTESVQDFYLCFADKKLNHRGTVWLDQDDAGETSIVMK